MAKIKRGANKAPKYEFRTRNQANYREPSSQSEASSESEDQFDSEKHDTRKDSRLIDSENHGLRRSSRLHPNDTEASSLSEISRSGYQSGLRSQRKMVGQYEDSSRSNSNVKSRASFYKNTNIDRKRNVNSDEDGELSSASSTHRIRKNDRQKKVIVSSSSRQTFSDNEEEIEDSEEESDDEDVEDDGKADNEDQDEDGDEDDVEDDDDDDEDSKCVKYRLRDRNLVKRERMNIKQLGGDYVGGIGPSKSSKDEVGDRDMSSRRSKNYSLRDIRTSPNYTTPRLYLPPPLPTRSSSSHDHRHHRHHRRFGHDRHRNRYSGQSSSGRKHYDSSSDSSDSDSSSSSSDSDSRMSLSSNDSCDMHKQDREDKDFVKYENQRLQRELNSIQPLTESDFSMPNHATLLHQANSLSSSNLEKAAVSSGSLRDSYSRRDFARADVLPVTVSDPSISFDSIGGLDSHVQALKEMIVLPLLYPEVFANFGTHPPRGVLFTGPPGTGKTLTARVFAQAFSFHQASDSNANTSIASSQSPQRSISFFMRKGADCLSKWVGEGERQLRLLFHQAQMHQPSIIFFDEIDGLAPVRSVKQDQIHASMVSTLLALMDGLDSRGQVVVMAATNRPDAIDPALRRPGRFDRELRFSLPDAIGRKKILEIHTAEWNPPLPVEWKDWIVNATSGYGGADIKALCAEASLLAVRRVYPQIYDHHMTRIKLDISQLRPTRGDFAAAISKIVPSAQRSALAASSASTSSGLQMSANLDPVLSLLLKSSQSMLMSMLDNQSFRSHHLKSSESIEQLEEEKICNNPAKVHFPIPKASNTIFPSFSSLVHNATKKIKKRDIDDGFRGFLSREEAVHSIDHYLTDISCLENDTWKSYFTDYVSHESHHSSSSNLSPLLLSLSRPLSRCPRILIAGDINQGQEALLSSALQALDHLPQYSLDFSSLLTEPLANNPEQAMALRIDQACRSSPSVLYLPHFVSWWMAASPSMQVLLESFTQSFPLDIPVLWIVTLSIPDIRNQTSNDSYETLFDSRFLRLVEWFGVSKSFGATESLFRDYKDWKDGFNSKLSSRHTLILNNPTKDDRKAVFERFLLPLSSLPKQILQANSQLWKSHVQGNSCVEASAPANESMPTTSCNGVDSATERTASMPGADSMSCSDHSILQNTKNGPRGISSAPEDEKDRQTQRELRNFFRAVFNELHKQKKFHVFFRPVDPEAVPDYYDIITRPMDLETMQMKVDRQAYPTFEHFMRDIKQISFNAQEYNPLSRGDVRGRSIVHSAFALVDAVQSHAFHFQRKLGYDLFSRSRKLAQRLGLPDAPVNSPREGEPMDDSDLKYYRSILDKHQNLKLSAMEEPEESGEDDQHSKDKNEDIIDIGMDRMPHSNGKHKSRQNKECREDNKSINDNKDRIGGTRNKHHTSVSSAIERNDEDVEDEKEEEFRDDVDDCNWNKAKKRKSTEEETLRRSSRRRIVDDVDETWNQKEDMKKHSRSVDENDDDDNEEVEEVEEQKKKENGQKSTSNDTSMLQESDKARRRREKQERKTRRAEKRERRNQKHLERMKQTDMQECSNDTKMDEEGNGDVNSQSLEASKSIEDMISSALLVEGCNSVLTSSSDIHGDKIEGEKLVEEEDSQPLQTEINDQLSQHAENQSHMLIDWQSINIDELPIIQRLQESVRQADEDERNCVLASIVQDWIICTESYNIQDISSLLSELKLHIHHFLKHLSWARLIKEISQLPHSGYH